MHLKINSIGADRATREILERLGMDGGCEGVELVTEGRERPGLSVSREGDRLVIASSERALFLPGAWGWRRSMKRRSPSGWRRMRLSRAMG